MQPTFWQNQPLYPVHGGAPPPPPPSTAAPATPASTSGPGKLWGALFSGPAAAGILGTAATPSSYPLPVSAAPGPHGHGSGGNVRGRGGKRKAPCGDPSRPFKKARKERPQRERDGADGEVNPLFLPFLPGDSPEDVAKWIAERKARFPTKSNAEKRAADAKAAMEAGASLPQQRSFPVDDPTLGMRQQQRGRGRGGRGGGGGRGRGRGRGRGGIGGGGWQAEEGEVAEEAAGAGTEGGVNAGASDGSGGGGRGVSRRGRRPCQHWQRGGRCRFGDRCRYEHTTTQPGGLRMPKPEVSLLKKLLANEITDEHSRILQCFRFFVLNNFLQPATTSSDAPASCPTVPAAVPAERDASNAAPPPDTSASASPPPS